MIRSLRRFQGQLLICLMLFCHIAGAQNYPAFGPEIPVTIIGDTVPDAMEPFVSPDGNYLFFNSLNNGTTTTIYYATKVNDSTFTFAGRLSGANLLSTPHLDAVSSLDSANRFFWVTTRNYGFNYYNLFHGVFTGSSVIDTGRVYGNIYIKSPGWIIMDAAINYTGNLIYYANAFFNGCPGLPCISQLGIGQKVNDSTYNKTATSDAELYYVNDTGYLVYAENVTRDGLELYYTRIKKSTTQTELCVSVRSSITDTFSLPSVIYTSPVYITEAATLTTDKTRLYYHKKGSGNFKIFLRYRYAASGVNEINGSNKVVVYPNPATDEVHFNISRKKGPFTADVYDVAGRKVMSETNKTVLNISRLTPGIYVLVIKQKKNIFINKITRF